MNWSLLRLPAFRALWVGRLLSWIGSGLGPVAFAFAAIDLGADPVELGVVVASRAVPNVVLILFGGAVADRLPKRTVAMGSSILSAVGLAGAAGLLATRLADLPLLAVAAAVSGAGAAFFAPATNAVLREVVGEPLTRAATVLNRAGMNIGLVAGIAGGGALVGFASPEVALAVGSLAFTFAVAAFAVLPRRVIGSIRGRSFTRDLVDGLAFVMRTKWLLACLTLVFVGQLAFAGGVQVLGPFAADDSFGRTPWGLAGAVQIVGLVVGAAIAGRLRARIRLPRAAVVAGGMGLPLVVLALILQLSRGVVDPLHWFFWLSLALFAASTGLQVFTVALDTTVHRLVPRALRTQVYACLTLAALAGMPIGQVAVGPLYDLVGAPLALAILAALVAAAVVAVAANPRVRRLSSSS